MSSYRDDDPSRVFGRGGRSRPLTGPGHGPRDHSVDEEALEEIDDFRPPNPRNPLAEARPAVVLGAVLTIGAILALIVVPFLPVNAPSFTIPALIAGVVLGLVILFLQMPRSRSGSGDGAQV